MCAFMLHVFVISQGRDRVCFIFFSKTWRHSHLRAFAGTTSTCWLRSLSLLQPTTMTANTVSSAHSLGLQYIVII